ncbi:hypothetical protein FCR2A7T_28630 [Flavobacterium cauense R2A-7]|uniref:DUF4190 domain-containing protein n=1 Tax=Flavobacterium cauense R2A-7 TaxID=1341154 RepID=V6RVR3_9FLAO|nr:CCC motif membrane protein [Flavobacterium cauense]ESU18566.1 hypothetical protein FCR2A7T_28630 [Flavobacterium cauense R2A-7]KGO80657.1 hypothetical protein Q762_11255 [Flavobacterium cauense R2A-7]TWI11802.1 hypothetical protein IP98_01970 [Flavobacterium cauense R2A-7]
MEKQKLPNQQAVMILGILSYIGCCCSNGIVGVLLSGIGIYLANKDEKLLAENPENYLPGSLKTWKIINIVSLVISSLFVFILIYLVATGKYDEMQEQYIQMLEEMQKGR